MSEIDRLRDIQDVFLEWNSTRVVVELTIFCPSSSVKVDKQLVLIFVIVAYDSALLSKIYAYVTLGRAFTSPTVFKTESIQFIKSARDAQLIRLMPTLAPSPMWARSAIL